MKNYLHFTEDDLHFSNFVNYLLEQNGYKNQSYMIPIVIYQLPITILYFCSLYLLLLETKIIGTSEMS